MSETPTAGERIRSRRLKVGQLYSVSYQCRDIGYGVEDGIGDYVFRGRETLAGKLTFEPPVIEQIWNVVIRGTGGIRSDFALHASTPGEVLREAARSMASTNIDVRKIELQKVRGETIYLFDDEILSADPIED